MQHIKGRTLYVKLILSFVFDLLGLFLSFKNDNSLIKIDQGIQIWQYHWNRMTNSYCFL